MRRKVYTSPGHRCGVIPYSSLWCGGLPLGLMMNSTKEEQPREGCSCGGVVPLEGSIPDASVLWWLALYIEQEALVLFPNIEREGRQQLAILKGNI